MAAALLLGLVLAGCVELPDRPPVIGGDVEGRLPDVGDLADGDAMVDGGDNLRDPGSGTVDPGDEGDHHHDDGALGDDGGGDDGVDSDDGRPSDTDTSETLADDGGGPDGDADAADDGGELHDDDGGGGRDDGGSTVDGDDGGTDDGGARAPPALRAWLEGADGGPIDAICSRDDVVIAARVDDLRPGQEVSAILCPPDGGPGLLWGEAPTRLLTAAAPDARWPIDAPDDRPGPLRYVVRAVIDGASPACDAAPVDLDAEVVATVERPHRVAIDDVWATRSRADGVVEPVGGDRFTLQARVKAFGDGGDHDIAGDGTICLHVGDRDPAVARIRDHDGSDGPRCHAFAVTRSQDDWNFLWDLEAIDEDGASDTLRVSVQVDGDGPTCGGRFDVDDPVEVGVSVVTADDCDLHRAAIGLLEIEATCLWRFDGVCPTAPCGDGPDCIIAPIGGNVLLTGGVPAGPDNEPVRCYTPASDWTIERRLDDGDSYVIGGPGVVDHGDGTARIPAHIGTGTDGALRFIVSSPEAAGPASFRLSEPSQTPGNFVSTGSSPPIRWVPTPLEEIALEAVWGDPERDAPAIFDLWARDRFRDPIAHHALVEALELRVEGGTAVTLSTAHGEGPGGVPLVLPVGARFDEVGRIRVYACCAGLGEVSVFGALSGTLHTDSGEVRWQAPANDGIAIVADRGGAAIGEAVDLTVRHIDGRGQALPSGAVGRGRWLRVQATGGAAAELDVPEVSRSRYRVVQRGPRTWDLIEPGRGAFQFDGDGGMTFSVSSRGPNGPVRFVATLRSDDGTAAGHVLRTSRTPAEVRWR